MDAKLPFSYFGLSDEDLGDDSEFVLPSLSQTYSVIGTKSVLDSSNPIGGLIRRNPETVGKCSPNSISFEILRLFVANDSVWTIDLAFILWNFGIPFAFLTKELGVVAHYANEVSPIRNFSS